MPHRFVSVILKNPTYIPSDECSAIQDSLFEAKDQHKLLVSATDGCQ
jgi:hypothetical protein